VFLFLLMKTVCKAYAFIRDSRNFWHVIGLYLVQAVIGFLKQYMSLNLIGGFASQTDVYNLLIVMVGAIGWSHFTKRFIGSVLHDLSIKFWKEQYQRFDDMCYSDKTNMNTDYLREKQTGAWFSIRHTIEYGVPRVIKIVETTSLVLMAFIQTNSVVRCVIMVSIMMTYWWKVIKPYGPIRTSISKEGSKTRKNVASKVKLIMPFFAHHQMNQQELYEAVKPSFEVEKKWSNTDIAYGKHFEIDETLCLAVIMFGLVDSKIITLLYVVYQTFTNAIDNFFGFLDWYNDLEQRYDEYESLWTNKKFAPLPDQKPYKGTLTIRDIQVTRPGFFIDQLVNLNLKQGDKVLIQGPSGGGKSTFLDALLGKIPGLTLNSGYKPECYLNNWVELYQSIKDNLPTSNITWRDLFFGEHDDSLIYHCLDLAKFNKDIKASCVPGSGERMVIQINNPLDNDINGSVSGGEKMRLAIAIQMYRIIKTERDWVIMDEPEQCSDPPLAYQMITGILDAFSDKTFLIVSHLEKIRDVYKWHKVIHIENGHIQV